MSSPFPLNFIAKVTLHNEPLWLVLLSIATALAGSFLLLSSKSSGLSRPQAIMAFAFTWLGVMVAGLILSTSLPMEDWGDERVLRIAEIMLLFAFGVPFVIRLYSKWIGGKTAPAELAAGGAGVRAWLSPSNVIMASVVSVMAWLAFDISLALMLVLTFGLLLAYPALHNISPRAIPAEPGAGEREKVLAMLEAGRITVEESAELLNALGASQPAGMVPPEPLSEARRLTIIGACVVLAGFFFPWFTMSPGKELSRAMESMREQLGENFPIEIPGMTLPQNAPGFQISTVGSEIPHGMGWMVLAFAMTAALLPFFAKSLDRATLRLLQLLALGVGTVMLLSVLGTGIRWVSYGLVAAAAGYAVTWVGLLREGRTRLRADSEIH